jgi:hypothetical protein
MDETRARPKFKYLLVTLVLLLVSLPVVQDTHSGVIILQILFSAVLIAGMYAASAGRPQLLGAVVLAVPALIANWMRGPGQHPAIGITGLLTSVGLLCLVGWVIVSSMVRQPRVTRDTVGGLFPLWLGGGPMWEPMAIAIIFGLIFAKGLTLGLVPVLYSLFFKVSFEDFSTDSVGATWLVGRIRHGVHHGEEPFGELIQLALPGLIGFEHDHGVMPPLGLDRHGERPKRATEAAAAAGLLGRREPRAEEPGGPLDGVIRIDASAVEVFHPFPFFRPPDNTQCPSALFGPHPSCIATCS